MLRRFLPLSVLLAASAGMPAQAATGSEAEIRDFICRWNSAYTALDASALASLETHDFELVDRFGHWIKSEGPEFNRLLWSLTFHEIYHGKPGPARTVESIRFLAPEVAVVEARANHRDGVMLDDGTHIPPFWEIDTYTLVKTTTGWRVALLNIHNQIEAAAEGVGQHVPNASAKVERK